MAAKERKRFIEKLQKNKRIIFFKMKHKLERATELEKASENQRNILKDKSENES